MACCSGVGRDGDDHRRRSQAPRRAGRHDQRAAHLGIGADPSSPHPHDRARRRPVAGRHPVGRLQAGVLPACAGAVAAVPAPVPRRAAGPASRRCSWPSSAIWPDWPTPTPSPPGSPRSARSEWVVYAKPPFGGPEAVLAYLSRYTHRVAISNNRLVSADADTVAFRWKDYRIKRGDRQKVMRLATGEFIRRFLIHVLPDGFHRIRHYGLLASAARKANIAKIRALLGASASRSAPPEEGPRSSRSPCASHAPAAAARCASSRSSGAGRNRGHAHHRGSRPHDETPIPQTIASPAPHGKTGRSYVSCLPTTPFLAGKIVRPSALDFPSRLCRDVPVPTPNNSHGPRPRPTAATTLSALSP